MSPAQLLKAQKIISTREFQSKFAAMLKKAKENGCYYNVVKHSTSVGIFMPTDMWENLLEDFEALQSPRYLASIRESREQVRRGELVDIEEVFRHLNEQENKFHAKGKKRS